MAAGEDALALLTSIDASLKAIALFLQRHVPPAPPVVASDADLDGEYGDPEVKMKDPRDWTGPSMKGHYFSECPPEYLDLLADRFDYFADQAEANNELYNGKPVAPYKRKDAARARGWAKRIREGKVEQAPIEEPASMGMGTDAGWSEMAPLTDDDIPL